MEIDLRRTETGPEGTLGILEGEALRMDTIELPWEENKPCVSCIPLGRYLCLPHVSPRFGKCFHLQNVPGRTEILIHPANWGGDVTEGWKSDLLGCIGVGFGKGEDSSGQDMILNSRKAMSKLIEYTGFKSFWLNITSEVENGFLG